jgi:hypothetical protein
MLHWPETMFTYLMQDKILFTCDFFGMHTAYAFYDDEIDELNSFAQRYFGEIMMPFRSLGLRAMEKIKNLEVEIIAPSHGPIHKNPKKNSRQLCEVDKGRNPRKSNRCLRDNVEVHRENGQSDSGGFAPKRHSRKPAQSN